MTGDVRNFVDPFFGSGAVLPSRPDFDSTRHIETVNDKDGYIANTIADKVRTWAIANGDNPLLRIAY